jgi:hypothetical protein
MLKANTAERRTLKAERLTPNVPVSQLMLNAKR